MYTISHYVTTLRENIIYQPKTSGTAIRLAYKMANERTTKALKDMNLEDLIPLSLQESITLDIINKLSIDEFRKLGPVK